MAASLVFRHPPYFTSRLPPSPPPPAAAKSSAAPSAAPAPRNGGDTPARRGPEHRVSTAVDPAREVYLAVWPGRRGTHFRELRQRGGIQQTTGRTTVKLSTNFAVLRCLVAGIYERSNWSDFKIVSRSVSSSSGHPLVKEA